MLLAEQIKLFPFGITVLHTFVVRSRQLTSSLPLFLSLHSQDPSPFPYALSLHRICSFRFFSVDFSARANHRVCSRPERQKRHRQLFLRPLSHECCFSFGGVSFKGRGQRRGENEGELLGEWPRTILFDVRARESPRCQQPLGHTVDSIRMFIPSLIPRDLRKRTH